jgi:hypothetical protein
MKIMFCILKYTLSYSSKISKEIHPIDFKFGVIFGLPICFDQSLFFSMSKNIYL